MPLGNLGPQLPEEEISLAHLIYALASQVPPRINKHQARFHRPIVAAIS